jgi:hypothetical protein
MVRVRTIRRLALLGAAEREALVVYRAAFKAGQLGTAHRDMVQSVYQLAADELLSRAAMERRRGRWALATIGLMLVTGGLAIAGWHIAQDSIAFYLLRGFGFVPVVVAVYSYASASTFEDSARLLAPPARRRVKGGSETTPA